MSPHRVDTSVVLWSIRYCMSLKTYPAWDGIRLARQHMNEMDTGYLLVLRRDIRSWLSKPHKDNPVLITAWTDVLRSVENIIEERQRVPA